MNAMDKLDTMIDVDTALAQIRAEVERAVGLYPKFNSAHEGYAVLLEEVDELWDEIKKSPKRRDYTAMRTEAIQVAAMAIRLMVDSINRVE
jgi:hypothetical protein